jgi:acyl carrier protein
MPAKPLDRIMMAVTIYSIFANISNSRRFLMSDTLKKVTEVIVEVLKIDEKDVKEDVRFVEDLKADSMDQFFLIDGFCEKFDININDEDARTIKTVGDAVKYIDSHKK